MRTLITLLLLILTALPADAQNKSSLKIPGIPGPMYWYNAPKRSTMKGTELTIVAGEKSDMFRDPNVKVNTDNAPKLLFKADPNFVLSASVRHAFTAKWDAGGIVVVADSLNWVKFCFEKDYTGAHRVVSVVTKGISDDANAMEIDGDQVYLKVAKADNVLTLYSSSNGRTWFLVRHVTFDTKNPLMIGFLAQSPTGKGNTVTFDGINYAPRKIKDPYTGE